VVNGSTNAGITISESTGAGTASLYFNATSAFQKANITNDFTGNTLQFGLNTSEKMRLDNGGNLLVGQTSAGYSNSNSITLEPSSGGYSVYNHVTGSSSGNKYIYFAYGASLIGSITQNGTTGVLYNITSDQRLKTNIVDAPDGNIDQIKIRSFDWKADNSHVEYGFIAQELLEVAPYAVSVPSNPDEMMGVDYSKLVPMMIKEIQSLKQRILTLESK
jgi:hypothetical protein